MLSDRLLYVKMPGTTAMSALGCEFNWSLQHRHGISLLVLRILMFFLGVRSTTAPLDLAGLAHT